MEGLLKGNQKIIFYCIKLYCIPKKILRFYYLSLSYEKRYAI